MPESTPRLAWTLFPAVADRSFRGDAERNASIWHGPSVYAPRVELLLEHVGVLARP